MKKIKNAIIIFLLINLCFLLVGCKKNEKEELKQKVISELGYVNIKIIDMLNLLNNLTFENYTIVSEQVKLDNNSQKQQSEQEGESGNDTEGNGQNSEQQNQKQESESQDLINTTKMVTDTVLAKNRNDIDWNSIKPEIERLNESWSIIVLDLYSLNTKGDTILDFSSKLDHAMIAIKNEDKPSSLTALANLYVSLPEFLKEIDAEENLQRIRQTQSYVINAYSLAEDITNPEVSSNIQKAVDIYSGVISDIDYTKDKTYKTNKIYVLLNELANSMQTQDSDIFYVKYKNFMEAINEL